MTASTFRLAPTPAPTLSSAVTPPRAWSLATLTRNDAIPSFVVDSWLKSYRSSERAGVVPNNLYNTVYSDAIRQLHERGMSIIIAHNNARPDHILGYLAFERTSDGVPVVHFAFVKDLYREYKPAMFASMFEAAGVDPEQPFFVTFSTGWENRFKGARYMPAVARRKAA